MRVAIAEDSVLLREGVAQLLTDAGIEVTARCGTADELLATRRGGSTGCGRRRHPDASDPYR